MLVVFFRALILFAVVFIVIRLMGKRELSKVQPFELAIIVMISDLASAPMQSRDTQIFSGIIPIIVLLIVYAIFTLLIQSNNKVESAICGSPSLVVFKGKIIEEELRKQQLTIEELMAQLRAVNIYKVQDTAYALLETSGTLNAVKISDAVGQMPLNVISDGQYLENNLKILELTHQDIEKQMKKYKVDIKEILIGTIDEQGKFIFQTKEDKK
ncbi:MAG: DUF421 domain-containing protein [Clostridia bacterium]|nr:DUF421 domain-containing protein [Clostridia bacterium]